MAVERLFLLLTSLVLAAGVPLALIAARGFWDAPFGRILTPIPVVFVSFIALNAPTIIGVEVGVWWGLLFSSLGVLGSLVAAVEAMLLLGGYREL